MTFAPKRILLPVSFDHPEEIAFAKDALSWTCDIAQRTGASIHLLYISPPLPPAPSARPAAYDTLLRARELQLALAKERLAELEKAAKARGIAVESELLAEDGSIPELIVRRAGATGAELIAITSHSRKGVRRLLLGSVAERVAHLSPIPVLIFREPPAYASSDSANE